MIRTILFAVVASLALAAIAPANAVPCIKRGCGTNDEPNGISLSGTAVEIDQSVIVLPR